LLGQRVPAPVAHEAVSSQVPVVSVLPAQLVLQTVPSGKVQAPVVASQPVA
jgi:hypothetical protein